MCADTSVRWLGQLSRSCKCALQHIHNTPESTVRWLNYSSGVCSVSSVYKQIVSSEEIDLSFFPNGKSSQTVKLSVIYLVVLAGLCINQLIFFHLKVIFIAQKHGINTVFTHLSNKSELICFGGDGQRQAFDYSKELLCHLTPLMTSYIFCFIMLF